MQPVIEAVDLSFRYQSESVFQALHFSVRAGDFVALTGANGAGKSTLLGLMLGELNPAQGAIRIFGENARSFRDWSRLGYVPQNAATASSGFPASVEEIVASNLYALSRKRRMTRGEKRERVQAALAQVGMQEYSQRLIGALSGGQRQRVLIARTLVAQPQLMLLDEPSSGVDAQAALQLYELLHTLHKQQGITILMVTHDIARAHSYASRTFCLEQGSMVELGEQELMHELSHRHSHPEPKGEPHGNF